MWRSSHFPAGRGQPSPSRWCRRDECRPRLRVDEDCRRVGKLLFPSQPKEKCKLTPVTVDDQMWFNDRFYTEFQYFHL